MNDTPFEINRLQFEIVNSIPLKERLEGLFELTEMSRGIIRNRIKTEHPEISDIELEIEVFKTFYRQDFDEEGMNQIINSMIRYLDKT